MTRSPELDAAGGRERGQAPIELANAGIELGAHDGGEDEVVHAQLGVEAGQAGDLDAQEDGDIG